MIVTTKKARGMFFGCRSRGSKYDPFREQIIGWCEAGVPVKTMASILGTDYTWQGVDQYIRSRGLRPIGKQAVIGARNCCDRCDQDRAFTSKIKRCGRLRHRLLSRVSRHHRNNQASYQHSAHKNKRQNFHFHSILPPILIR